MQWKTTQNKQLTEVKNKIFAAILLVAVVLFAVTAVINMLNNRPIANAILPLIGAVVMLILRSQYKKNKKRLVIKYGFLIFICCIYLPAAWLTSPGSYSAMAFYAMVTLFISIIMVNAYWDYIFPVIVVIEMVILLHYEATDLVQYALYTTPQNRALDLSINFIVASSFFFVVFGILNNYFDIEHKRMFNTSITDPLTGIYNRRYLYQILEDLDGNAHQYALVMMDLNHFKAVNDNYGHSAGDDVLRNFGNCLTHACRKRDLAVRYGGDEFVLVLMDAKEADARLIELRIVELFKPVCLKYQDVGLSVSFGIAESVGRSVDTIIQIADDHLYKNKNEHKKEPTQ